MNDNEKVIDGLRETISYLRLRSGDIAERCIKYQYDAIELLEEQEPKSGHWIDSAGVDKCSVCGAMYSDLYPDYQNTHYCPNCGAKMIGQAVKWNG